MNLADPLGWTELLRLHQGDGELDAPGLKRLIGGLSVAVSESFGRAVWANAYDWFVPGADFEASRLVQAKCKEETGGQDWVRERLP